MRLLLAVAALAALAFPATAVAGGWATVQVSPPPGGIDPGEPWRATMVVKQHGITPLDDADLAGPDAQAQLVRLVQNPVFDHEHLTIVLSARPRGLTSLGNRLAELLELRIELEPWEEAVTVGYVQFALLAAGADRPLFHDQALVELHRLSEGVPRRVNRLAEYALLIGASAGHHMIDVATAHEAHESLNHEEGGCDSFGG
jgi:hypothetical protein